jgi:hypothetical protein
VFKQGDVSGLKLHYKKTHGVVDWTGIKFGEFEVLVSEGYYDVLRCNMCDEYMAFNEKRMAKHKMIDHDLCDESKLAEYISQVAQESMGLDLSAMG